MLGFIVLALNGLLFVLFRVLDTLSPAIDIAAAVNSARPTDTSALPLIPGLVLARERNFTVIY